MSSRTEGGTRSAAILLSRGGPHTAPVFLMRAGQCSWLGKASWALTEREEVDICRFAREHGRYAGLAARRAGRAAAAGPFDPAFLAGVPDLLWTASYRAASDRINQVSP